YIEKTCKVIINATPDGFEIKNPIKFDLAVIHSKDSDGKIDVKIATFGKGINAEITQRIQFQYDPKKEQTLPPPFFVKGR
ncbi:MAG: hypothetical protein ACFFAU_20125, partial [Candidatus Hodarchaeota archaeon]